MTARLSAPGAPAERRDLPMQSRLATVGTVDVEARTVELVWSTGAGVRRTDWWTGERYMEELSLDPSHVDLARLNAGAPLLDTHGMWRLADVIGVVERAWIAGGEARALVRFSAREEVAPILRDVQDGIIRNVSVGYAVRTYEIIKTEGALPIWRAVDWEPMELSLVPVGADAGAGTRAGGEGDDPPARNARTYPCQFLTRSAAADNNQEHIMTERTEPAANPTPATPSNPAPAADATRAAAEATRIERERIAGITAAARLAGLGEDFAQRHIDAGTPLDATRAAIFDELATRAAAQTPRPTAGIETVRDETETRRAAMGEAMLHRLDASVPLEAGRQYRGMSLLRLAEESLTAQGINVRGLSRLDIASRAFQTGSDFAFIAGNVANRRLRDAYAAAAGTYQQWARRAPNAPDFKEIQVGQLSEAPDLDKVNEHGEFKYGQLSDGKEKYNVITYGVIVGFTRQLVINDDLRAFDQLLVRFARSAARKENRLVYAQITANPTLDDGVALFHATHGNLAGSGAAIAAATLGAGRTAMRLQKGLQSEELNVAPRFLLVPATQEQLAYQYTSNQFVPAQATNINEFRAGGRTALEPIVDPVLDAASTTAWYLASDPMDCDTVEYCWLDGNEGAYIESGMDFDIDGIKFKCRLDFGTKVVDHRGLYKNAGA